MKILMILMGLEIGGAETHVVELSKELARRGRDITVVSSGGVYVSELKAAGITHIQMPTDSRRIDKMLRSYIGLYKLIKRGGFDVVHAHARIPAFLCAVIRKFIKFRFITTAHWVFKTGPILNVLTNWGERTIAVSDDIKQYLRDNYSVLSNHVTVTINGIDTEKFSPLHSPDAVIKELKLNPSAKRAVYVSRIDIDRSAVAFLLINIMPELCKRYPDFELLIVGGGNDYERLEQEAKRCNDILGRKGIILAGPRIDINNFIACADIFIGVSRAALEAMAAAKPVIIAGNEGYIGLFDKSKLQVGIDTNFCCRGCEPSAEEGLYRDITVALDYDQPQRQAMGDYNRNLIIEKYSAKRMADDCEGAYADLLSIDSRRPYDIMISGYYGYKNAGDDSLLYAIVNSLTKEKPNADIMVLSANPGETSRLYGVRSIYRFNLIKILYSLKRTKLLISGGGSLLQDVTSTKSLFYYLFVIWAAKKQGAKAMIYASGIGPIKEEKNKRKTAKVLSNVNLITLREPASAEELRLLNVEVRPTLVTADPAFSLNAGSFALADAALEGEGIDKSKAYFVVSVRQWKKTDKHFNAKLAQICDYLSSKYSLTPLFIPMQGDVDCNANQAVALHIKSPYSMLNGRYSAECLIEVIARSKLVIGMRLHTLIYAAVAGVPFFGLSYDPKVDSMITYLGQAYKESVEQLNISKIEKSLDEIIENHAEIKKSIISAAEAMRVKAENDARYAIDLLN